MENTFAPCHVFGKKTGGLLTKVGSPQKTSVSSRHYWFVLTPLSRAVGPQSEKSLVLLARERGVIEEETSPVKTLKPLDLFALAAYASVHHDG